MIDYIYIEWAVIGCILVLVPTLLLRRMIKEQLL